MPAPFFYRPLVTRVAKAGGGSDMHVAGLVSGLVVKTNRRWTGEVIISIEKAGDPPIDVPDATVSGKWSDGAKGSGSCTTDASGTCSVTKGAKLGRSMIFTVNDVTHATLNYAPLGSDTLMITINEDTPTP